ncbi:molecular chaperone DnaJ [Sorangium cellulosum]|uniref:Molecular chaperone DnaJ n=1 Tax=Sorangium cellulosum TaxID=56 RepID=A0A4P2PXU0_SORCE|nr:J domain-containing protein [Sorangium cellulosum]AUX21654.1 molecular chaperone DnaJ [Sorangium cellulosum]
MTLRVPRPKPGYDLRSLPLKPAEAFLLSRIDGVLTERELSLVTGMSHSDTVEVLRKLHGFGAIILDGEPTRPPPPRGAADAARRGAAPEVERSLPPGGEPVPLGRGPVDSPPLYDPAELDEPVELAPDRKRRILDLYYRLEDLTYYELLGVSDQADKKQIKSAYYQLAPEFHPDSYFRKQLGSYKQKIEAVFTRITLAHDTLTSRQRRAEYDAYLEQTHKNRAMAALIEQTPRDIVTVSSAVDASVRAAVAEPRDAVASPGRYSSERPPLEARERAPAPAEQAAASSRGAAAAPRSSHEDAALGHRSSHEDGALGHGGSPQPSPAWPAGAGDPVAPAASAKDRRETLARKLTAGLRRPATSASPAAPPTAPAGAAAVAAPRAPSGVRSPDATRAVEVLKARYDSARGEAVRGQIARYSEAGRIALQRKDYASAANAYRIAASLAPEDVEIQKASAEVQRLAAAALADGYLKQADYEAQNGRWVEAALSYAKVCSGRPDDAAAHERVAHATLQARENTRRAVEFARRAVELAPTSVEFRITLARAYAAAGLEKSAAGEFDRAAELAGNDGRLRALVAQAREQAKKMGKQV